MRERNAHQTEECIADGCHKTPSAKNLCTTHYNRIRRSGSLEARPRQSTITCTAEEPCTRKSVSNSLCIIHYNQKRRHGHTRPLNTPTPICTAPDCTLEAHTKGFCKRHYQRYRRNGHPTKPLNPTTKIPDGAICAYQGCERPQQSKTYCPLHYQRFLKYGDPGADFTHHRPPCKAPGCTKLNYGHGYCKLHYQLNVLPTTTRKRTRRGQCKTPGCERHDQGKGYCQTCVRLRRKAINPPNGRAKKCQNKDCIQPAVNANLCERHYVIKERITSRAQHDQNHTPTTQTTRIKYTIEEAQQIARREHRALGISHPILIPTKAPWMTAHWNLDHYTNTGAGPLPLTPENLQLLTQLATEDLKELLDGRGVNPTKISFAISAGTNKVLAAHFQTERRPSNISLANRAWEDSGIDTTRTPYRTVRAAKPHQN